MKLPTGTVTFLFTDIEGSTKLWERDPEAMRVALAQHDSVLRAAIEAHNGHVFKTVGDAFCAAFATAADALNAALDAHLTLAMRDWSGIEPIRVRMGLHTGVAEERDNDYFGQTLNRVARLQGIGHGQQTLLSQATYELVHGCLPPETALIDLGHHRLKDLAAPERVWQVIHPQLPAEFPALRSLNLLSTNLPQQLTSFIGREKELAEIKDLLGKTRLLTLTGSGGTGKTRLSLQASADVLEQYPDGVWIVELAPLADPTLIPQAVAEVLNLRESPGDTITKTLLRFLKARAMLLVLDNCEHLLEASARLIDSILKSCPQIRVLVSSREALGIAGEIAYRLPSLSVPNPREPQTPQNLVRHEAVRLFIERATAANPAFALTSQNAQALASVCYRLDGIPLAIELAASRVRAMPLDQIESRLDSRFRLLTGGSRTALPRQQTLRALIDWSYDLLNDSEKAVLCRLSVFAGGWTLEGAEAVCVGEGIEDWEVLDLLTSLVDKSLVNYEDWEPSGRYRMLETVRQYARDRLMERGESIAVRQRHQDYFLAWAEAATLKLTGADQAEWLHRLEIEHENLRAGLDWSLSEMGDVQSLRFCKAVQRFWWMRGHLTEGREWSERALSQPALPDWNLERANVLNGTGVIAWMQGDFASARAYHEQSLALYRQIGDSKGTGDALNGLGIVLCAQGDYTSALTCYQESLAIKRELGDRSITDTLGNLGVVAFARSDYGSARAYYEESLALQRQREDRRGIALSLNGLGVVADEQGEYDSARAYHEESLAIRRELGDRRGIAWSLNNLGAGADARGDYVAARNYHEESLAIRREIGDQSGITWSLHGLAVVAYEMGDFDAALTYNTESMALRKEIGDRRGVGDSLYNLGLIAAVRKPVGEAATYLTESLIIRKEIGDRRGILDSLEAFAELALTLGLVDHAATLWGTAEALRHELGPVRTFSERGRYERVNAGLLGRMSPEALSLRMTEGRAMPVEQAIEQALATAGACVRNDPGEGHAIM
jgi:predicted ATPase/class 3 adenylate cyclase/Flp pilus assembly protein TadD